MTRTEGLLFAAVVISNELNNDINVSIGSK